MRLIDADALLQRAIPHGWSTPKWVSDIVIDDAPTIDAVPVVRCKDCKHNNERLALTNGGVWCEYWGTDPDNDDFCSRGERRRTDEA